MARITARRNIGHFVTVLMIVTLFSALPGSASADTPPPNDKYADALPITGDLPLTVSGTTVGAKRQAGENEDSVWYKWVAPSDGIYWLTVCPTSGQEDDGAVPRPLVSAHGSPSRKQVGDSGAIACDDYRFGGGARFAVKAGRKLRIQVSDDRTPQGTFDLTIERVSAASSNEPAPPNDDRTNAQLVAGDLPVTVSGTTLGATAQPHEFKVPSVWYRWTVPDDGIYKLTVCPTADHTYPVALMSSSLGAFEGGFSECDLPSRVSLVGGTKYKIAVLGGGLAQGAFNLTFEREPDGPANDDFRNAEVLSGPLPTSASGTNTGASAEIDEFGHQNPSIWQSVWYEWTAQADGLYAVSTCSDDTDFATTFSIWTGSPDDDSLERVGDPTHACGLGRRLVLNLTAGTTYRIKVEGDLFSEGPYVGDFRLNIAAAEGADAPPPNDEVANAEVLSGTLPLVVHGSTENATAEEGAGYPETVWYRWTAPTSGRIYMNPCGTPENDTESVPGVEVYTGSSADALTPVDWNTSYCGESEEVDGATSLYYGPVFRASAGKTYLFRVWVYDHPGTFELVLGAASPSPANDEFMNAQELTGPLPIALPGTNAGATLEDGEPNVGNSVWYRWTATADETLQAEACPEDDPEFLTIHEVSVYQGTSLDRLKSLGGSQGPGGGTCGMSFRASAGKTYMIAVSDYEEGAFTFKLKRPDDLAFAGVVRQDDGKLVAGGYSGEDFAVVRYRSNGWLDWNADEPSTDFGIDGRQVTDLGGADFGHAMALQPDGKIVLVGRADEWGANDWGVVRYNSDGSLDTGFSDDGKLTIDFGGADSAYGVALQPDGKIVVAGLANMNPDKDKTTGDFGLARLNDNGSLDTTFANDGLVTTGFGFSDGALDVAVQADGKIVAAGVTNAKAQAGASPRRGDDDIALVRYDADGYLDPTFSGDGKKTIGFGGYDWATRVALQDDGKIVVAGSSASGPGLKPKQQDFALARLNLAGSLDRSFSGDGKKTTHLAGRDEALALGIQPNGHIVVGGQAGANSRHTDFALVRYRSNGALDSSFSKDGKVTSGFWGGKGQDVLAGSIAFQPDGKIVAAGGVQWDEQDFGVARFYSDGRKDYMFGSDHGEVGGVHQVTTDFQKRADTAEPISLRRYPSAHEYAGS